VELVAVFENRRASVGCGPKIATQTVLITGAAGFVGSYCALHFTRERWAVIGVDRRPADAAGPVRSRFEAFEIDDLTKCERLCRLLDRFAPHAIIHAAGPASTEESFRDPSWDFSEQITPWLSLLESIRRTSSQARLVLCSSGAVYGNPRQLPVSESEQLSPISPYGYHKVVKELLLEEYVALHGVSGSKARIFSTFGPGLRHLAVWDIAKRMLAGDFRLQGTGEETRDYLYIEDVAAAILQIAVSAQHRGEAINVASGVEIEIRQLAASIGRELGITKINLTADSTSTVGKPMRWRADISRLHALRFSPSFSLNEGLSVTLQWIKSV
jgi:UDP-glucose 4-epimerase